MKQNNITNVNGTQNNETSEKIKKTLSKLKNRPLMDDLKFREVCKTVLPIQEMLRVMLGDPGLEVIKVISQRNKNPLLYHGVVFDCECLASDGSIINVEMQMSPKDNPEFRVRYNQSIITIENSPKDKNFKYTKIPSVISIMICDFDIFNMNKAIYEIERYVKGTNTISYNGIKEFYVYVNGYTENEQLKELFKILKSSTYVNTSAFPNLSKCVEDINKQKIGGIDMLSGLTKELCDIVEEEGIKKGRQEGRQEGLQAAFVGLVRDGILSVSEATKRLGISEEDFKRRFSLV